jgi:alanyl-tRNA synthetase
LRFDFSHKSGISDAELQKIEDISTSYIRQNCRVYSKDVPLAVAREIEGVRAVFGETYPDPVRVVSVGVEVDDLLKDVKNKEWRKVSVEFCGGTHVQKTGDIKDLIIIEENGIAKGIRRIIAVTGEDAHKVQRVAEEFSKRLTSLENMPFGPEKELLEKQTMVDLNELSISAITKSKFRERFAKIHKQVLEELKGRQKAESKKAIDAMVSHLAHPENREKQHFVVRLPISANAKALSDTINHVRSKAKDSTVYLFAADEGEGKVVHGCYVSEVSSCSSVQ